VRVPDAFLTHKDTELVVRFHCASFGTVEGACKLTDVLGALPDPRLLLSAASGLESTGKHEEALGQLEQAATAYPHNPEVLNRLAWFLLTTSGEKQRNPLRALQLARDAVAASKGKEAHILDTLAAALHANGDLIEALSYAEKAAKLSPDTEEIAARANAYREELVKQVRGRRE
jgi:tetratricopeptide (TPR) repeat protein